MSKNLIEKALLEGRSLKVLVDCDGFNYFTISNFNCLSKSDGVLTFAQL